MPGLSRIGTAAAVVMMCILPAAIAAERALATIPIGDLVLWYDAAIWRAEGGGAEYAIRAADAGSRDPPVSIEVKAGGEACTPQAVLDRSQLFHPDAWVRGVRTIARPGFDLHVATLDMGCRNLTGSPVFACAAHGGRDYFVTANPGGCRETPPDYDGPVFELLMGLELP